jgi:hypothetical protein
MAAKTPETKTPNPFDPMQLKAVIEEAQRAFGAQQDEMRAYWDARLQENEAQMKEWMARGFATWRQLMTTVESAVQTGADTVKKTMDMSTPRT